jgi:hypothetical protein
MHWSVCSLILFDQIGEGFLRLVVPPARKSHQQEQKRPPSTTPEIYTRSAEK